MGRVVEYSERSRTTMKIVWSPQAVTDLGAVRAFIAQDDQEAARRITLRIIDSVETALVDNPHIGRAGRVPSTREFVVAKMPFIVPYRVKDKQLHVLRVYHVTRRWPEKFGKD